MADAPTRFFPARANESFRAHHFPRGVPVVSGATADCKIHPALVWWHAGGLDNVHVVLPGVSARGLRLRTPGRTVFVGTPAGLPLCRNAADCAGHVADHTWPAVEA